MAARIQASALGALLLLGLAAAPALAQTGLIVGRVTDQATNQPVASARVEALSGAGRVVASAFTNADGQFGMTNVPAGTYQLALTGNLGYGDRRVENVVVTAGQTTVSNVQLAAAAFDLAPIAVTGTRGGAVEKITETTGSTHVISQIAIEERPAVSMTDHLRNVQGVDIIPAGVQSSNVVVRGFNNIFSGSLHVLTDYRIASVPSLRVNFLHFIPQTNEDLQRMEVVLGPASALYGPNTANGVLHMITKSPFDEQRTSFSVAGGERDLMHVIGRTAHLITPTLGFKVSGQFMRADDWSYLDPVEEATRLRAADPATRPIVAASMPRNPDGTPLTDAEIQRRLNVIGIRDFGLQRWSADARVDWRPTSDFSTVFSAGRMMSNSGVELTGIGAGQVNDWAYDYFQLRSNWRRLFAQVYLNMSDAGDTYLLRTGSPIVDRSRVFASQLQHGIDLGLMQSFTYGIDYIRTMPETDGTINGSREDDDLMQEWGAYVQSTTRLTPQFDLVLAGRVDDHSHLPDVVFSPRAALVFKPAEDQSFRVTYNRAFSTPSSLNLFLDIDAGWPNDALGAMGYRLRAFGPGDGGITFRNAQGGLYGMRSPSAGFVQGGADGATRLDIDPNHLYRLQIENFLRVAGAAGAQIAPLLRSFQVDPTLPTAFVALNPFTGGLISPADIQDVPGIRESISQTFEVGYKGLLGERILLGADVWFDRKENFTSPLIAQTPMLLMHPEQLAGYLIPRLTAAFMAGGMPQAQAQATATATAMQIVQVPGAVVASPNSPATASDVLATYRNFGQVDLWGVDLGATMLLTDAFQLGFTASIVSDDHFILPLDGVDQVVALNAPKRKGSATLTYRDMNRGWNGELRLRHNAEFPANSAGYVGMQCVDFTFGPTVRNEECVQAFNLIDVSAGYRLPMVPGASIQLSVQNLLNDDYRAFVGTPTIGRMALLRLKYDF